MNYWDKLKLEHVDLPPDVALTLDLRGGPEGNFKANSNFKAFAHANQVDVRKNDWQYIALTWAAYFHRAIDTGRPIGRPTLGFDVATHFHETQKSENFDEQMKLFAVDCELLAPKNLTQHEPWRLRACIYAAIQHPLIGVVGRNHSNNRKDLVAEFLLYQSISDAARIIRKFKGKTASWPEIARFLVAMDQGESAPILFYQSKSLNEYTVEAKLKRLTRFFKDYTDEMKNTIKSGRQF